MSLRILVTGGSGFLGSHLCERLLGEGHRVVALDNFYTGPRDNVAQLVGERGFYLVEHDVREPFPAMDGPFDRIFHMACPASPPHYQRDPIFTLLTAVLGTQRALERAEADGARILIASTSEVYGDPELSPQPESYRGSVSPTGPRACYDEGKRAAEALTMDMHRHRGVDVRVARIFNTYGPHMALDDGRVVSNFLVQALRGEPLTVYGDGTQSRSFCYVDDLLEGLCLLMDHPSETGPVNLGNPHEFTMLELAEKVRAVTGLAGELVHEPLPVDDPKQRCPDIARARTLFGYEPKTPLETGLALTAQAFRARLG